MKLVTKIDELLIEIFQIQSVSPYGAHHGGLTGLYHTPIENVW